MCFQDEHGEMNESIRGVEPVESSSHDRAPHGVMADGVGYRPDARNPQPLSEDPLGPIRALVRRWRLFVVFAVIGGLLGWASAVVAIEADTTPIAVDHYQARHVLVLDSNIPDTQATLGVRNLNVLAKRITIGEVPQAVAETVGRDVADVATQIRVLIRSDSETIDLVAIGETPALAEELADAYAAELLGFLNAESEAFAQDTITSAQSRVLEAEENIAATQSLIASAEAIGDARQVEVLQQDLQQFESARIQANAALLAARADGVPIVPLETLQAAGGTVSVISESRFNQLVDNASIGQNIEFLFRDEAEDSPATGALNAVSDRLPTGLAPRVAAGTVLGLFAALVLATILNRFDTRVRSKRQVEGYIDLPVIAEIPALKRPQRREGVYAKERPRSRFAEQYRTLASTLGYARRARGAQGQVVLVTSPGPSEGKTTSVANLGAMLAEAGESVLLINCDFRRPRLHVLTGADYLPEDLNRTLIPDVELISNVVSDADALPTEVIAAQRKVIEKAKRHYDLIIIDTAPLLATNDAVDLLDLADDVLLVMRAGRTTLQAADRAAELLDRRRAHVLGVVISDVDARHSIDYYYYGGYYDESRSKKSQRRTGRSFLRRKVDIDLVSDDDAEEPVLSRS